LYISDNKLVALPESLKDLKNLTIFRANNNNLSDFPDFVLTIPKIENIDISSNSIRTIPTRITELPNLNIFVLGSNPINKEEIDIEKIVTHLMNKGTIVHQNYFEIKVLDNP
jgi:Leucine-rich repeat (LRR) protein